MAITKVGVIRYIVMFKKINGQVSGLKEMALHLEDMPRSYDHLLNFPFPRRKCRDQTQNHKILRKV